MTRVEEPRGIRIGVLFVQTQPWYTADVAMQALLVRHLDRSAVRVHLACTGRRPPGTDAVRGSFAQMSGIPGVRLRRCDFGANWHGGASWRVLSRVAAAPAFAGTLLSLADHARRRGLRIVHANEKPRDALAAVLIAMATGAKTIIHMHTAYGDWMSALTKWSLRHADAIIAVSHFTARSLTNAGYPRDRIFVVHNGIEVSKWDADLDGASVRRSMGVPPDAPLVGIFGSLYRWKGHGDLLEALALVRSQIPDVRLLVVGHDNRELHPTGGSYRADLDAQARRLGLGDSVIFTGFREDVPRLMAALDAFALPSYGDAFPTVVLEAMAMRKPVVGWAAGGGPEAIEHGRTGLIADFGSVSSLAQALLILLRDRAQARSFGIEGRRRVSELFTARRMADGVLDVYRATLARPRAREVVAASA